MSAATLGFRRLSTPPCAPAQSAAQRYGTGAGWMDALGKRRLRQGVAGSPVPRRPTDTIICVVHILNSAAWPTSETGWFTKPHSTTPISLAFLPFSQRSGSGHMGKGFGLAERALYSEVYFDAPPLACGLFRTLLPQPALTSGLTDAAKLFQNFDFLGKRE